MSLEIAGLEIERIAVVDDNEDAREALSFRVEDLGAQPVLEDGPLESLIKFSEKVSKKAQAAILDQHLRKKNYSNFNGAEAAAHFYAKKFPAVLCTQWEKVDLTEIRQHRRRIPVLLRPNEINSESIVHGFELCINEFKNKFSPERKPWRTLVRVVDEGHRSTKWLSVVIPAWNSDVTISLHYSTVPPSVLEKAKPGMRFFAQSNIGAESPDDLYIDTWEI